MTATLPAPSEALPRWDVSGVYPSLTSPEFADALAQAVAGIAALGELFDRHGIGAGGARPPDAAAPVLDDALTALNDVLERMRTLFAYVEAFVSTDSRDELAQARRSELLRHDVALTKLETRLTAWIGSLDVDALIERSELARAHAYALRRAQTAARHLMSQPEEELAAELELTGGTSWWKLHGDLTSQIVVPFERDGETRELPMSELRALAHDPDRGTRRRAYTAELAAWEAAAVPLAAALNSIKGETNTLTERRGWPSPLAQALWTNRVDEATLDAMIGAIRDTFPALRRYLRAKARLLGVGTLAWYDLEAPIPATGGGNVRTWDFDTARDFVLEHFGAYSTQLRGYAARAFAEHWIDAEPRAGKLGGAFCMGIRDDESRILMNFTPSHQSVGTLAHELGHGYHNALRFGLTPLQRRTPSTLAETASTFCEAIVREAALAHGDEAEQLEILEGALQDSVGILVDTTSRFFFEQRVLERRRERELSVAELCELMLEAQRETYGDALAPDELHPYMWAVKPHYYGSLLYNFPYSFGLLFGLGLYGRYVDDPDGFRARYDDLLAATGLDDAAELAARFDIDIRTSDFWRRSLEVVEADVERFESAVPAGGA